ncbi:PspC domain-containing protein [Amycolatopsis cynarae]|uniref:PspC domain-containing protein n=1 Tax=Amycolatopsis cynarae TaxID=2995223 RepID=A0ABY7ATI5_9PSEU|nr:PspC domain-containing protein [Amycolatopsis sp. HUAS 11-8]WAL63216.1 PspC domain-containing protein [Amycolatopsis sp. HUAS 11-8]
MTTPTKRLTRSRENRVIAGVCGGIAERLGWQPGTVRLLAVLSCLLPGPQFLIYLLLWITLPDGP